MDRTHDVKNIRTQQTPTCRACMTVVHIIACSTFTRENGLGSLLLCAVSIRYQSNQTRSTIGYKYVFFCYNSLAHSVSQPFSETLITQLGMPNGGIHGPMTGVTYPFVQGSASYPVQPHTITLHDHRLPRQVKVEGETRRIDHPCLWHRCGTWYVVSGL